MNAAVSDMSRADWANLDVIVSNAHECHGIVTHEGIQDACSKPAVAIVDGRHTEDMGFWPACAYHANRYGPCVPLKDILDMRDGIPMTAPTPAQPRPTRPVVDDAGGKSA